MIMSSTYDFAEPGFVLVDRINERTTTGSCENIRATNPCGEQPLPPYGACLLGSVNLTRFVDKAFTDEATLQLGRVPQGGQDLHPHARQRGRDQWPAAGPAAPRDRIQAPPRHGLSSAWAPR
jgi:ribonucleotide reductase alpha subunit